MSRFYPCPKCGTGAFSFCIAKDKKGYENIFVWVLNKCKRTHVTAHFCPFARDCSNILNKQDYLFKCTVAYLVVSHLGSKSTEHLKLRVSCRLVKERLTVSKCLFYGQHKPLKNSVFRAYK